MIIALRLGLVAALLLAWELASGRLVPEFFVSRPSAIAVALANYIQDGMIFFHMGVTATEAIAGFLLGGGAGFAAGLLLGRQPVLADVLDPFLTAFYSLPKVALAPLYVLWFGIGIEMKIVLAATIVFFLVFLNTYSGVRQVSREQLTILRLMGASEWQTMRMVVVPSAVSWVFTGLRLSVPYALIGAIVGEMIASNRGLGFVLSDAAGQFSTANVFAALLVITVLAILLNMAVRLAEKMLMPWQHAGNRREFSV
ncbi:MAG: ABC transporter permease [Bosea sp.]|uniref:ABC transporter permease n=1 Tax=Bosea sp. (in: a-proteobacteria) TaxID=1871050 RepID=UPI001AC40417|nr:ABC transporter permease [Bosea sp. (in: a-proteobacteria)]MBN9453921.1 ABC transporter permease [Bosea sp. (in: a-proteobacteria)]